MKFSRQIKNPEDEDKSYGNQNPRGTKDYFRGENGDPQGAKDDPRDIVIDMERAWAELAQKF